MLVTDFLPRVVFTADRAIKHAIVVILRGKLPRKGSNVSLRFGQVLDVVCPVRGRILALEDVEVVQRGKGRQACGIDLLQR
jgi:hypothetical protein